ncbi:MAG: DUF4178 domain-containing protein [candidate division NC10 bacterium]|nr:DUF4178 domain-containing protein [candidate division NC10 bacterium]
MTATPQAPVDSRPRKPAAPSAKTLTCSGCGAPLAVRAPGHSLSVACGSCGAVLDAKDPNLQIIASFEKRTKLKPLIPLGTRGRFRGQPFEVIGFLVRQVTIEGETFAWSEYLLFNPFQGFRWLTEYQGHWISAKTASGIPKADPSGGEGAVSYLGATFRHFQMAEAETIYVLGEFPWRVQAGERVVVEDYISPPRILSSEVTPEERTWSIGEHVDGEQVWKAFKLSGSPPPREGVGVAEPSPYAPQARTMRWLFLAFLAAAFVLNLLFGLMAQNRVVYSKQFQYVRGQGSPAVVTEPFELTGRRSNVLVEIATTVTNQWAYFTLALIDEATGQALDFGREVAFYAGVEDGESWTEGSRNDSVYLSSVPSGRYYLLISPETDAAGLGYTLRIRRDVPRTMHFFVALGLLAILPLWFWFRKAHFEYRRWRESDHPWVESGGSDEDDD